MGLARSAQRSAVWLAVVIVSACGSATTSPGPSQPSIPPATAPAASAAGAATATPATSPSASLDPRFAGFELCPRQPGFMVDEWLCDTVDVPLDRSDPAAGTIPLAVYVLPHTDTSVPAGEPVFTSPGGPGVGGYENFGIYAFQAPMRAHHDIVTVDPRGTGASDVIDCPELQAGSSSHDELLADIRACAETLKGRTDRYGGANRGMDMEAVRQRLGYDKVAWYAPSYGSVDAQAYVARYPEHVRALVLDAGFEVDDAAMSYWLGPGYPEALIGIAVRGCKRAGFCAAIDPDPEKLLREMIATVHRKPITGPAPSGSTKRTNVDPTALAVILGSAEPADLVNAAKQLHDGSPDALLSLTSKYPQYHPDGDGDPKDFSSGANIAGYCNDQRFAWDPSDPPDVRRAKYDALIKKSDAQFVPFTAKAWGDAWAIDQCIVWPAPTHYDPVVPAGTIFADIPTLILSGDVDTSVTTDLSRVLLDHFPKAKVVVVAGAQHPSFNRAGACAPTISAHFFETLDPGDTSCAATAP